MRTYADGTSRLESFDGEKFNDALRRRRALAPRAAALVPDRAPTATSSSCPSRWASASCSVTAPIARSATPEGYPGAGPFCGIEIAPGHYWFGDRDSIVEFKNNTWRVVRSGMMTVRSLIRARDGTIWAAAGTGLHAHRDGSWVNVNAVEGLPDGAVYDVLQDRNGVIWAATSLGPRAAALRRRHGHAGDDAQSGAESARDAAERRNPAGVHRAKIAGVTPPVRRLMYSWRVDDGAWSSYTTEAGALLTASPAGMHRVDVRAIDRNWNVDPTPAVAAVPRAAPWYRETGFLLVGLAGLLADRRRHRAWSRRAIAGSDASSRNAPRS